ncbi:MAG: DUF2029 domain-containing protein [Anaerolineae bacterium]|nr:DUF2029 domain-containing protein [Anaerolineae bacterium]
MPQPSFPGSNGKMPRLPAAVVALLIVVGWAALALASYHIWTHGANHRDFFPRWVGARLAIYEQRDLYSDETTRLMRETLYGRQPVPGEDPQAFAYPALIVPLLLPFWWIPDMEAATALWQATSVLLLLAALIAVRRAIPEPKFPAGWIGVALFTPYVLLMIYNGQITAVPLAALAFAYAGLAGGPSPPPPLPHGGEGRKARLAYDEGRKARLTYGEMLGGAALAAGFIKPELVALPALLLVLLALVERRWRFLGGMAAGGALLFAASLIVAGWWVPGWLEALTRYADYAQVSHAPLTLLDLHPAALIAGAALTVALTARLRFDAFSLTAGGAALGMLLLPQTLIWGLTLLSLPLAMSFRRRAHLPALIAWAATWGAQIGAVLLTDSVPEVWRWQNALLPLIVLIPVALAARQNQAA